MQPAEHYAPLRYLSLLFIITRYLYLLAIIKDRNALVVEALRQRATLLYAFVFVLKLNFVY